MDKHLTTPRFGTSRSTSTQIGTSHISCLHQVGAGCENPTLPGVENRGNPSCSDIYHNKVQPCADDLSRSTRKWEDFYENFCVALDEFALSQTSPIPLF